jgi:phosphate transport system substrate-binding protein
VQKALFAGPRRLVALFLPAIASWSAACAAQPVQPTPSEKSAIDRARDMMVAAKFSRVTYTKEFDLGALPEYVPETTVSGTIRMRGANYFTDSPLAGYWVEEFRKWHPDVKFDLQLRSSQHAISSLIYGVSDISPLGRAITNAERLAFQREFQYQPLGVIAVTGSHSLNGWNPATAIYVHKSNPLTSISMEQLDGVFGAQRTGGWPMLDWDTSMARGPEKNIRRWGQLGVRGALSSKPIRVFGYTLKYNFPDEMHNKVFGFSFKWNEALEEYGNKVAADGSLYIAGQQMMDDLAKTPDAIAYITGSLDKIDPNVKVLPIVPGPGEAPVWPTLENIQNRSYPLAAEVFFYMNRKPGTPLDPMVREFMRYVFSRQGQMQVMRDGKYLPLTAELAEQGRKALD